MLRKRSKTSCKANLHRPLRWLRLKRLGQPLISKEIKFNTPARHNSYTVGRSTISNISMAQKPGNWVLLRSLQNLLLQKAKYPSPNGIRLNLHEKQQKPPKRNRP